MAGYMPGHFYNINNFNELSFCAQLFEKFADNIYMGESNYKNRHQASIAIVNGNSSEKKSILNLYSRIIKKKKPESHISEDSAVESVENDSAYDLAELLRVREKTILVDTLKKIMHQEFDQNFDKEILAIPIRKLLMSHPDESVRYLSTKSIGSLKDSNSVSILINTIYSDFSEKVKEGAVRAIGLIGIKETFQIINKLLKDVWGQSIRVRSASAFALAHIDAKASTQILIETLVADPDEDVRSEAAKAIGLCLKQSENEVAETIATEIMTQVDYKVEESENVRINILDVITSLKHIDFIDFIIKVLEEDPSERVRGKAANTLVHFFDPKIENALIRRLNTEDEGVKKRIALAIAQYAMKNPLGLHDEVCNALIEIQKIYPKESYIWKEAVKALPAC